MPLSDMSKNRGLELIAFMSAVSPEVLARYFSQSAIRDAVQRWFHLNAQAFQQFVLAPENGAAADPILYDFETVDALCRDGAGLVFRAYSRFNLPFDERLSPQELGMLLFLDHPLAFDFARSRYLLYSGGASLSVYSLSGSNVSVGQPELAAFEQSTKDWFAAQAKGENVVVQRFEDGGEVILLVQHGALIQTQPYWEGPDIAVSSIRPAVEDVLTFDPESSELRIKAGYAKDRSNYLDLFCRHMADDPDLAERARRDQMFTLEPVRQGRFNYKGKGPVKLVELVGVSLQIGGASKVSLNLRADDVLRAFQYDLQNLSLKSGLLLSATFRFHIQQPGKRSTEPLTFSVTPPTGTNVGERKNAAIGLRDLKDQGVKLK